jgi:hypothetical protein
MVREQEICSNVTEENKQCLIKRTKENDNSKNKGFRKGRKR